MLFRIDKGLVHKIEESGKVMPGGEKATVYSIYTVGGELLTEVFWNNQIVIDYVTSFDVK